jgi:peptidoglycan/LPS O-acetylase OafA/YrhL
MGTTAYRSDIDGLRGVAVSLIVLFHLSKRLVPGGFVGVDVFFVISGYLVGRHLFSEIDGDGLKFGEFYARRVKRLFPALFVLLLGNLGVGYIVYHGNLGYVSGEMRALVQATLFAAGSLSNIYSAYFESHGYFDAATELKPLTHLWSLGVEEQFYIVWPLFVTGVGHFSYVGQPKLLRPFFLLGLTLPPPPPPPRSPCSYPCNNFLFIFICAFIAQWKCVSSLLLAPLPDGGTCRRNSLCSH